MGSLNTYEEVVEALEALQPAVDHDRHNVRWIGSTQRIGVARDGNGRVEIFLKCGALDAEGDLGEVLSFRNWYREDGKDFAANRLRLPQGPHFDALAAACVVELLRFGFDTDPSGAFDQAKPLILLAFKSVSGVRDRVTGIIGELVLFEELIVQGMDPGTVLSAWCGYRTSSRDFRFGSVGVEVKTTTRSASWHRVSGWYQVEPGVGALNEGEDTLFLMSFGLDWLQPGGGDLTPQALLNRVASRLSAEEQDKFWSCVRAYLLPEFRLPWIGDPDYGEFTRPFEVKFARLYDMADENIRVLKSGDVADFVHVGRDSVEFEVRLPNRVTGDLNPIAGVSASARAIIASM